MPDKQTQNKRPDGKFAERNTLGRRFRPGQSGNPKGRPKSISLSEAYRKELAKTDPADPDGRTYAEVLAEKMREKACGGDVAALREMADRTEGKAVRLCASTRVAFLARVSPALGLYRLVRQTHTGK
jgi:hypothetical protein